MRLFAFILALLMLAGSVDPTRGWLITLVVVTGIAAFHLPGLRPVLDVRLATFVLAVLLLAGTIDPTREVLIALVSVAGVALLMPRWLHIDLFGLDRPRWHHRPRRWRRSFEVWSDNSEREWDGWERRMDRRARRSGGHWS
jgi:hypothetical protein